jgi:hypothetical protein
MGDRELDVVGKRFTALDVFLGDHVEDVMEFPLRLFRRGANRVTTVNRRDVGDVTAVVVPVTDDLIIEERFHGGNLAHEPGGRKPKSARNKLAAGFVKPAAIRCEERANGDWPLAIGNWLCAVAIF